MSKVTFCYGLSPYRCFGVCGSCLHETDDFKTDIFRRQPWQNVLNCPESHSGELGAKQSFLCFRTRQNAEYFKGRFLDRFADRIQSTEYRLIIYRESQTMGPCLVPLG